MIRSLLIMTKERSMEKEILRTTAIILARQGTTHAKTEKHFSYLSSQLLAVVKEKVIQGSFLESKMPERRLVT